jgi:hypothetical protein
MGWRYEQSGGCDLKAMRRFLVFLLVIEFITVPLYLAEEYFRWHGNDEIHSSAWFLCLRYFAVILVIPARLLLDVTNCLGIELVYWKHLPSGLFFLPTWAFCNCLAWTIVIYLIYTIASKSGGRPKAGH